MKKLLLTVAILATILVMSCEDSPKAEVNPFVGTWEDVNNASGGVRYIFTKNRVDQYDTNRINNGGEPLHMFSGTYIYDNIPVDNWGNLVWEGSITITTDYRHKDIQDLTMYPNPFVWPYFFNGNILQIAYGTVKLKTNN